MKSTCKSLRQRGLFLFILGFYFIAIIQPVLAKEEESLLFDISLKKESLIIASSLAITVFPLLMPKASYEKEAPLQDISRLPFFDAWSANPYSKNFDLAGDFFQYTSLLLPAVLLCTEKTNWLSIGVMYAESIFLSYGLKNLGKALFPRYRPYTYFEGAPFSDDTDFKKSFPSGHTTMAFTGASFLSSVFARYYPESQWKWPVILGSFSFATTTAALRIASGNHFFTDLLSGALLGSFSGFIIPYLHRVETKINRKNNGAEKPVLVQLNISSFSSSIRFLF